MEKYYGRRMPKESKDNKQIKANKTNREILDIYLNDGTLRTCVECQFAKLKNTEYMEDFFNDMIVLILEYDNEKLNDVHRNKHFNAWVTRIIINNLFSSTSVYYRTYIRYGQKMKEIDESYNNLPDEDF